MYPSACGGSVGKTGEACYSRLTPYRQSACNGLSARVPRDSPEERNKVNLQLLRLTVSRRRTRSTSSCELQSLNRSRVRLRLTVKTTCSTATLFTIVLPISALHPRPPPPRSTGRREILHVSSACGGSVGTTGEALLQSIDAASPIDSSRPLRSCTSRLSRGEKQCVSSFFV